MKHLLLLSTLFISAVLFGQSFNIKFYTEKVDNTFHIYADNAELTPMSARFDFTLDNMTSSLESNKLIVIPAEGSRFLVATLKQLVPKKSYSFKYRNSYNFGNVEQTSFDEDFIYTLPFEIGKSHRIYQGYDGKFSHQNQKALDFDMTLGEKIYAARGGKVVSVESSFDKNCATPDCGAFNNQITIMHKDGSFGEYLHLMRDGVAVKLGDLVMQGDFIGNSGNTGWSKGPHLHFSVYLNRMDGQRYFIPTKFKTTNTLGELLEEKQSYLRKY